jgi:hypothetical protein
MNSKRDAHYQNFHEFIAWRVNTEADEFKSKIARLFCTPFIVFILSVDFRTSRALRLLFYRKNHNIRPA